MQPSDYTPDPRNANRGTDRGRDAVEASLKDYGAGRSILVDKNDVVIAGNKTVEAAKKLGLPVQVVETEGETLVVVKRNDLDLAGDDVRARLLAYADNRASELGLDWDPEIVLQDSEELDLSSMFDEAEMKEIIDGVTKPPPEPPEPQLDRAEELREKWGTQRGQVWRIGEHRMMCGDATSGEDVAQLLDGEVPFIMVTDPPYGVDYDPEWRNKAAEAGSISYAAQATGSVQNDDQADWSEAYTLFPGDVVYVWHASLFGGAVASHLSASNFQLRSQIIWRKSRFAISRGHYHWQHEAALYGVRKGRTASWCGDRSQSTIWDIDHTKNETGHGTQKPIECMARPIRNHGGRGDAVYDPFLGSGTTMVAAEQLGRRCYGMEIDPKYAAVILERMAGMELQPTLVE